MENSQDQMVSNISNFQMGEKSLERGNLTFRKIDWSLLLFVLSHHIEHIGSGVNSQRSLLTPPPK